MCPEEVEQHNGTRHQEDDDQCEREVDKCVETSPREQFDVDRVVAHFSLLNFGAEDVLFQISS